MRRFQSALALCVCVVLASVLAPSAATADTIRFSGHSGTQRWVTCVPEVGCRPYRIGARVVANILGAERSPFVAVASFGIFYSTAALGPDTLLVYGFEYRKRGGKWRRVCVRGRCLFDSRKRASWPGERGNNDAYFEARLPIAAPRNIQQIKLLVKPLTETGSGRFVGRLRSKVFSVRYSRCSGVCALPSTTEPVPTDPGLEPPEPAPPGAPPAPAPSPAPPVPPPAPAPARDVCATHPSDPSVVCVRNQGHTVDVCDRHADGHRAYARVITEASNPAFQSPFYDDNDSQAGCANLHFPSRVLAVAVCVQYEGCSAFKPT